MKIIHNASQAEHHGPQYLGFENQSRLTAALEAVSSGFLKQVLIEEGRSATWDDLRIVHSEEYLEQLKAAARQTHENSQTIEVGEEALFYEGSMAAILSSTGAALSGLDSILSSQEQYVMCLTRPAGHHAEASRACGYCFCSNAAISALRALSSGLKVAVFDFDMHQGNGTEQALRNRENSLFAEIYLCGEGEYPYVTRPKNQKYVPPPSASNVIKVALPPLTTSYDYRAAFESTILPALVAFSPDLLICSAGFDCLFDDPVGKQGKALTEPGGFALYPRDIYEMTQQLVRIGSPILSLLEGGYSPSGTALGILAHLKAMEEAVDAGKKRCKLRNSS